MRSGGRADELAAARDALAAYLAGSARRSRRLAGPRRLRRRAPPIARATPRSCCPSRRRPRPRRTVTGAMNAALAAARRGDPARLRAGLRAAVPPARARRDPRLIWSPARWSGRSVLGLVGGAESKLHFAELGIILLLFLVGLELNPARLWRMRHDIFVLGLLQVVLCGIGARRRWSGSPPRSSLAAALALGLPLALVLDRAGAAAAAIGRAAAHPVRRARLLDPAVPGPLDRAADHDHRGDVAQPGRRRRAAGLAAGALHVGRDRRAGAGRPLPAAARCSG